MRLIRVRSHVKLTSVLGERERARESDGRGVRMGRHPGRECGGGRLGTAAAGFMARKNRSLRESKQLNIVLSPAPAEAAFKCASVQSSYVITRKKKSNRRLRQHGDRRGGGGGCEGSGGAAALWSLLKMEVNGSAAAFSLLYFQSSSSLYSCRFISG